MKKKRLLLGFLSVLLVFTLVGCNNKKAENRSYGGRSRNIKK